MKRITTAVDVFLQLAPEREIFNPVTKRHQKFKLSFITLTISAHDPVPHDEAHKALKAWLQHFKRPWHRRKMSEQMSTYLWKAELQERGQIHYHVITNAWLHLAEIRRVWNDLQKARGWTQDYFTQHRSHDPNSTDVHSIYKIKDVGRYLSKYIAKQQFKESPANPEAGFPALLIPIALDAKVWGCSEDLKGKKRFSCEMDKWTYLSMKSAAECGILKEYPTDHAKFYDLKDKKYTPADLLSSSNLQQYQSWKK